MAALAVPGLVLALGLAACGGGSAPGLDRGASAVTASPTTLGSASGGAPAAPEAGTEGAQAPATSAIPATSAAPETSAQAGTADLSAVVQRFIAANAGFREFPAAQAKAAFTAAGSAIEGITVTPAACKAKMIESVEALPDGIDLGMALKQAGAGTMTITYFGDGAQYLTDIKAIYEDMEANCNTMQQQAAGVDIEVSMGSWEPQGVDADNVFGTIETSKMSTGNTIQTKVFGLKNGTAFQVQIMSSTGGAAAQAEAVSLAKEALAALEG